MHRPRLAIVLHAHLPYVRHPEHVVSLEEHWLFEAMAESYMPLLDACHRLRGAGIAYRLALSLSPTLLAMLADADLKDRFDDYLARRLALLEREEGRLGRDRSLRAVLQMYRHRFERLVILWHDVWRRDLIGALCGLRDSGHVELLTTAATHAFLPYLGGDGPSARAQVGVGLEIFRDLTGRPASGLWLPECGYTPGMDELLVRAGVRYTVLEAHGVLFGRPAPPAALYGPVRTPAGLSAFPRHPGLSGCVWRADGYPADPAYREYYRDIGFDLPLRHLVPQMHPDGIRLPTGLKYFSVTGTGDAKRPYSPERADARARHHARSFADRVCRESLRAVEAGVPSPLITCAFDAELFGHWWFEGPQWLAATLRELASGDRRVRTTAPGTEIGCRLGASPVSEPVASSWGEGGFGAPWLERRTDWLYPELSDAETCLLKRLPETGRREGNGARALECAARELLLAQSSDWPFMMSRNRSAHYARRRFAAHMERCRDWLSRAPRSPIGATTPPMASGLFRHIRCTPFFR